MPTQISDLWTPQIWIDAMREKQATFPSLLNSGVMVGAPLFDEIAAGAGVAAQMPVFRDISDQDDEVQIEDTAPSNDQTITGGTMIAPLLNRVTKNSASALSGQVAGADPVNAITDQLVARRMKQRQKTLLAIIRGAFDATGANAAACELNSVRLVDAAGTEPFDETGNDATAGQIFNADHFINGKALLLELADTLANGAFWIHPNVLASLERSDKESFKDGVESGLPFTVRTYRGVPIFTSELLRRNGTGNGSVYDSYIIASGVVAKGEKAQEGDTLGAASLQGFLDRDKNNFTIWDRTRFVMHLNGMKWVGTPAAQSATNTELATAANWDYVYSTDNRAGIVCIRTNG